MKARFAFLALLLLWTPLVRAQDDDKQSAGDETATAGEAANDEGSESVAGDQDQGPSADDSAKIDEILAGEEDVLQGVVSTYDPGNRRDPFRSLLAPARTAEGQKRPEGAAGLLIDEIAIRGIFHTSKGWVAQISAQNQRKSFLLREGQQVFDGDVLRIQQNEVVFRQIVNDPTVIKPFREVVKKLRP